jgi:hypothetical protein
VVVDRSDGVSVGHGGGAQNYSGGGTGSGWRRSGHGFETSPSTGRRTRKIRR